MRLPSPVLILPVLSLLFSLFASAASAQKELALICQRRIDVILSGQKFFESVPTWLSTLTSDGTWPDVDYKTGCEVRRANWPAMEHWKRITAMSGAWHSGARIPTQHLKSDALRSAISRAMKHWLDRDFTNKDCLDRGGQGNCPCTNPDNSYWNKNWFSNVIGTPRETAKTALFLSESLSSEERAKLIVFTTRAYGAFATPIKIGAPTGANALDIAQLGVDQALLTRDVKLLAETYGHARGEVAIKNGIMVDGVRADGSFGQHDGLIYNGNYGNDFGNAVLNIESGAAGTSFTASKQVQSTVDTFVEGNAWIIYENAITHVHHFCQSVIGRMISSPVFDGGAAGSIRTNITQLGELGPFWSSKTLTDFASRLSKPSSSANAGGLVGNRMFYNNDYMVHHGPNYVSTLKMFSTRTMSTECVNAQNLLGVNLGSGTLYNYVQGDEYEDIHPDTDMDLIPGFTVAYKATPAPKCAQVAKAGLEAFVGGASTGKIGMAVMRYQSAHAKTIGYQKAYFFFPGNVQPVMVAKISRTGTAPVYSVLDQKKREDKVYVDDVELAYPASNTSLTPTSLWHSNVGYTFNDLGGKLGLSIKTGVQRGDWSKVGISTQPPIYVDLFAAWIEHKDLNTPLTYVAYPGVTREEFTSKRKATSLKVIQKDVAISAIYDAKNKVAMISFWEAKGGKVTFTPEDKGSPVTVSIDGNAAVILNSGTGELAISDPSQTLTNLALTIVQGSETNKVPITLPKGGLLGKSIVTDSFSSKEAIARGNNGESGTGTKESKSKDKSSASHSAQVHAFGFVAVQLGLGSIAMLLSYL